MTGDENYTELRYNEQDIINKFLFNQNYVDFYLNNNFDLNNKITKINNKYLKSEHKVILTNQDDKTENGIYTFDENNLFIKTNDLDLSGTTTGTTYITIWRHICIFKIICR
jgi:hypothetical protein